MLFEIAKQKPQGVLKKKKIYTQINFYLRNPTTIIKKKGSLLKNKEQNNCNK